MRFTTRLSLIATAYLTTTAYALPRPATYSVVNVDGGQTQTAQATTIIQTVTKSTESETTVSVTIVATTTAASVLEVTATNNYFTNLATETALIPEVSLPPKHTKTKHETHKTAVPTLVIPEPGPAAQAQTVTVVTTATPTTSYYDNGMWHTSYAIKPTTSPQPVLYTTSSATRPRSSDATASQGFATGAYVGWNTTMH